MNTHKVLILAYDFPPYVSVGGLRPYSWYKYLKQNGIDPVVISRQWENKHGSQFDYISSSSSSEVVVEESTLGTIIRTPYFANISNKLMLRYGANRFRLLRRIFSAYYELTQYVINIGPKVELYKAAKEYMKDNKVDLIIATGEPYVLFRYAHQLSKLSGVPWIADYRDSWVQKSRVQNNVLLRIWFSALEKKILKNCSRLITVSEYLAHQIAKNVKNKEIDIISNGYDLEYSEKTKMIHPDSAALSFALVGSVYEWHPIRSLLKVFSEFVSMKGRENIKLYFYGINVYANSMQGELHELIAKEFPKLSAHCVFNSKISNKELLIKLSTHHVMLLFNDYSIMGTKIFDYIGISRKILFCYENDDEAFDLKRKYFAMKEDNDAVNTLQIEVLRDTNSGIIVKDEKHLLNDLNKLYDEYQVTGTIACQSENTDKYSRKYRVAELAGIIKEIIKTRRNLSE